MLVRESLGRDILRLIFWYPVRWLLLALPPNMAFSVLERLGDLHRLAGKGKRLALQRGLDKLRAASGARGPAWDNALTTAFRNHYVDRFVMFIAPKMSREYVLREMELEGLEHLDAALAKGKGAVVCIGHFGPVHLPLVSLALLGYPLQQIGMPSDKGLSWIGRNVAFRLRLHYEAKIPARIVNADGFLRPSLRWLAENKVLMVTGDGTGTEQRFGRQHCFPFLGLSVDFPLGPARICASTGAELLALFILPGERKRFRLVLAPPLIHKAEEREQPERLMGRFAALLEHHVLQCPGYMHFLDRLESPEQGILSRESCVESTDLSA